ncbi:hypothetical protein OG304_38840 [Streptomyces sp. NBC_00160]|uniref:hypothetical protein n=1 Tax=Streptomyces sp. NBC_00160 TaxID=2903628 RepID=UPI00224E0C40|nr:hypothetical protein [Streptomyces sp. NBC_00160]MCX5309316.1 hypothetical protein [Streptomyces sp. NBC_00160]
MPRPTAAARDTPAVEAAAHPTQAGPFVEFWQYDPSEVTVPQLDLDPYRFPGADTAPPVSRGALPHHRPGDTDRYPHRLGEERPAAHAPAPAPASDPRLARSLTPVDRRRLDLQAALTTIGVPPRPGDLESINILASLDDTTHATLVRWITTSR